VVNKILFVSMTIVKSTVTDSSYDDFFLLRPHVKVITFPRESYHVPTCKLLRYGMITHLYQCDIRRS